MTVNVKTNSTEKIIEINNKIRELNIDVDIKRGKFLIDGSSLMGCLSLNYQDGCELIIHSDDEYKVKEFVAFLSRIKVINE